MLMGTFAGGACMLTAALTVDHVDVFVVCHSCPLRSVNLADLHRRLSGVDLTVPVHTSDHIKEKESHGAEPTHADNPKTTQGADPHDGPLFPSEYEHLPDDKVREEKRRQIYAAALRADQNAKLAIFATRPAIYSPGDKDICSEGLCLLASSCRGKLARNHRASCDPTVFNFLTEFLATTALIAGALLIVERAKQIYPSASGLWAPNEGIYLGIYIFVFVLAWGGPTGVACNFARDTAPRLAHWLLPIPNKGMQWCSVGILDRSHTGPSEWFYAPIPFFASLVGGAAGAGMYMLINLLNASNVEAPTITV